MALALAAPGGVLASGTRIKLALQPVGQAGSFFDLTLRPGETRKLDVELSNAGTATMAARTYASDVYTIIDGGFGARLRDEPQTGVTRWLDYPTQVVGLPVGAAVRRTFWVAVPLSAKPGEYISSLVLENDDPIRDAGPVAIDQIVRQAIAVVITVPGKRAPALAIGEASHALLAGRSVVAVGVENPGNVRLRPVASFTLRDAAGVQVSQTSVAMDTFYAHTRTSIEVPLDRLLQPGTYTVRLSLDDVRQGARAVGEATFVVQTPPGAPAPGADAGSGLAPVIQARPEGAPDLAIELGIRMAALGTIVLVGFLGVAMLRRRRTRPAGR